MSAGDGRSVLARLCSVLPRLGWGLMVVVSWFIYICEERGGGGRGRMIS